MFHPVKQYQNIPYELLKIVLLEKRRMLTPLNVYLCLTMNCSGKTLLDPEQTNQFSKSLKLGQRSFKNSIKTLKKENWIGYNDKTGYWYVRGFGFLTNKYNLKSNLKTEIVYRELEKGMFKTWIQSVILTRTIGVANYTKRNKKRTEQIDANSSSNTLLKGVNLSYLEKVLGVPKSTVFLWIDNACNAGYLNKSTQYSTVWTSKFKKVSTVEFKTYMKSHKDFFGKCFIQNDKIVKREANIYTSSIKLFNTKRKKAGTY